MSVGNLADFTLTQGVPPKVVSDFTISYIPCREQWVPLPNGRGTVFEFKVFLVVRIKSFNTFFNSQLMLYRYLVFANNPTHEIDPI